MYSKELKQYKHSVKVLRLAGKSSKANKMADAIKKYEQSKITINMLRTMMNLIK